MEEINEKVNELLKDFVKEQILFNKWYQYLIVEDQIAVLDEYNYQLKCMNEHIKDILENNYIKEEEDPKEGIKYIKKEEDENATTK